MSVGRKGAFGLVVAALLWMMLPLTVCVAKGSTPACCRGMMMQCGGSADSVVHPCCAGYAPDQAVPPAQTSATDFAVSGVALSCTTAPPLPSVLTPIGPLTASASPPSQPPRLPSVLRI